MAIKVPCPTIHIHNFLPPQLPTSPQPFTPTPSYLDNDNDNTTQTTNSTSNSTQPTDPLHSSRMSLPVTCVALIKSIQRNGKPFTVSFATKLGGGWGRQPAPSPKMKDLFCKTMKELDNDEVPRKADEAVMVGYPDSDLDGKKPHFTVTYVQRKQLKTRYVYLQASEK
ncbi:hypothetical protein B7494_g936 [Chlorociboria aeruginascens]|nr:hypothetical protein B7494_g936 [Chlorociboria aeruginascens]